MALDKTRLDGQVAIVTGGGGGIGRGIAIALAEKGARIVIAEIIPARGDEVAARVREAGSEALCCPVDMMDSDAVRAMVTAADAHFGRIDILINNVGGVAGRPFLEQSERSWRRHIDINLISMLAATHAAAPVMIRGGHGGAIVNVSSIEAARAAPNYAVYAACKAGMVSFTQSMALELSQHRIRVNAISPDHTISPGTMGNPPGEAVDEALWKPRTAEQVDVMNRTIPLLREGVAEECGDAAVFLCSRMSDYITGTVLPIDGGTAAAGGWVRTPAGRWTLNQGLETLR